MLRFSFPPLYSVRNACLCGSCSKSKFFTPKLSTIYDFLIDSLSVIRHLYLFPFSVGLCFHVYSRFLFISYLRNAIILMNVILKSFSCASAKLYFSRSTVEGLLCSSRSRLSWKLLIVLLFWHQVIWFGEDCNSGSWSCIAFVWLLFISIGFDFTLWLSARGVGYEMPGRKFWDTVQC